MRAGLSRATIVQLESADADPQLSTINKLAQALGISPALLLMERTDIDAIDEFRQNPQPVLNPTDLDHIHALIRMRVSKKARQAASLGADALANSLAADTKGMATAMRAGAAIGTCILPGIGTIVGGMVAAALSARNIAQKKQPD